METETLPDYFAYLGKLLLERISHFPPESIYDASRPGAESSIWATRWWHCRESLAIRSAGPSYLSEPSHDYVTTWAIPIIGRLLPRRHDVSRPGTQLESWQAVAT
jgi:hypothetical protein